MSMATYVDCLKSTALKNPIAEAIGGVIEKLNTIPLLGLAQNVIDALSGIKESLLSQVANVGKWISNIKDNLPLLGAHSTINDKMKVMAGTMPAAGGAGGLIGDISKTIEDIGKGALDLAKNIGEKISGLVSGGMNAVGNFISDLGSAVGAMASSLGDALSAVTDGIASAISDLKDYAFAKFSAMAHSSAMSDLLLSVLPDECKAPSEIEVKTEEKVASEVISKKYEEAVSPSALPSPETSGEKPIPIASNAEDIPPPAISGKSIQEVKRWIYEKIMDLNDKKFILRPKIEAFRAAYINDRYVLYPDFDKTWEGFSKGDPVLYEKYVRMTNHLEKTENFLNWGKLDNEYKKHDYEIERLQNLLKDWALDGYTNVPDGPPW